MHTISIFYRPDNYPDWTFWTKKGPYDLIGNSSQLGIGGLPSARAGFAPRQSFGKPADDIDRFETGRKLRRGYMFQVKFIGTGHVVLDRFRLHGQKIVERSRAT